MTFRFVPKFKEQVQEVSNAQKSMGRDSSEGSVFAELKQHKNFVGGYNMEFGKCNRYFRQYEKSRLRFDRQNGLLKLCYLTKEM